MAAEAGKRPLKMAKAELPMGSSNTSQAALLVAAGSALALAAAWYFQLVVGLAPCPLCLDQRIPYYVGVPLALLAFGAAQSGRAGTARALMGVLFLLMLANVGLASFHAGVEWRFWPGPTSCTGAPAATSGSILSAIKGAHVPRCDEAAWRLFGLSMAGWNALIAAALAACALFGATSGRKRI
ncbi:disulfide bond formation protein B [Xanthobacter pseudotagetidis]|uniref:disulfide bond formation protein B n=1 Tax=Xanthobacter pseudotagetidis TaxID=3119911 RepID=UPI00372A2158